jgi:hypothetical protein
MKHGMGSHQSANMLKDEWLTPKYITDDLGPFDLDPCSPIIRPWETAKKYHTIEDNGLLQDWGGFVWCNPPYGRSASVWLDRMSLYNNGIALVFARTETKMFQQYVWNNASCLLFIYDRLYFHHVDGSRSRANSGAPSVLIGYGSKAFERLKNSSIKGKFIDLT